VVAEHADTNAEAQSVRPSPPRPRLTEPSVIGGRDDLALADPETDRWLNAAPDPLNDSFADGPIVTKPEMLIESNERVAGLDVTNGSPSHISKEHLGFRC
jgi:hypothetical protein